MTGPRMYCRSPGSLRRAQPWFDADKFRRLVDAFRRGESVTPIIVVGDTAVTGSHRLAAAREAGTDLAVVEVPRRDAERAGYKVSQLCDCLPDDETAKLTAVYGPDAPILEAVRSTFT
ncbi:MAG: ParB N-terminal domain-containing protein [Gammaproteobacteria bacterium]|nr:ParB N-terminal domain-containing protein [Gammaproteobacteria bacterium]